jgi:hypothetical protein
MDLFILLVVEVVEAIVDLLLILFLAAWAVAVKVPKVWQAQQAQPIPGAVVGVVQMHAEALVRMVLLAGQGWLLSVRPTQPQPPPAVYMLIPQEISKFIHSLVRAL